jgi:cell wall-associated NlpC family hydrolase
MTRDLTSSNGIGSLFSGKARTVAAVAAFSGLALATTVSVQAAPAQDASTDAPLSAVAAATPAAAPAVSLEPVAHVQKVESDRKSEKKVEKKTEKVEKEKVETAVVAAPAVAAPAPKAAAAPAPVAAPKPAVQAAPAAQRTVAPQSSASGKGATISSAAMGQLGVGQDCTALVTNALRAAGINHHGWPASYLSLGTQVSAGQAQPGDLVYYADGGMGAAHIGVYIGGGKAVHGGWNGGTTVIDSVNVGSGPVYVRVR